MKKFILVDNQGNTSDNQHIKTGKFHMGDDDAVDQSVAAIMNSGDNSPILAAMRYPGVIDDGLKMFLLSVWDIDDDAYSIVKEVEMPAITTEHKLAFAIKAVGAIYNFPAYKKWADEWVSGMDRSMASLKTIQGKVESEIRELEEMQEVAYSMGLDIDTNEVAVKQALFERARVVFQAAEAMLGQAEQIVDQEIGQVFTGIEEFVDPESLTSMSDEIIKVA